METEGQRKHLSGISSFIRDVKHQLRVRTSRVCHECGDRIAWNDRNPCGSHDVIPDDPSVDQEIGIRFMPANTRPELLGPTLKRIAREGSEAVAIQPKPTKERPYNPDNPDGEEEPKDIWEGVRNTGGYSRSMVNKPLGFDSTTEELYAAIDKAERGGDRDDDETTY